MSDNTETLSPEQIEAYRELVREAVAQDTADFVEEDIGTEEFTEGRGLDCSYLVRLLEENPTRIKVQYASCYHKGKTVIVPWSNIESITKDRVCTGYVCYWLVTRTSLG